MHLKIGKYRFKLWFIIVMGLYLHTIMFSKFRILTYLYAYGIPIVYLVIHINDLLSILRRFRKRDLVIFLILAGVSVFGAIVSPLINGTRDFSFITSGPIRKMILQLIIYAFLIVLYKNKVSPKADAIEFSLYFVLSNALYVLGTLIICAVPSIHKFILNNIYMDEYTRTVANASSYYTRIGWSGYTSFVPSALCSLAIVFSALFAIQTSRNKTFIRTAILVIIMIVGSFCYARTGVISSLICIFLYLFYLIYRGDHRLIVFPILAIAFVVIGSILIEGSSFVKNWYQWGFAQIINFRRTGSFETATISSLLNMYKTLPKGLSWIIGDGRYTSSSGFYYMSVDVGWLRSIFYYGILFSIFQYGSLIVLIWSFSKGVSGNTSKNCGKLVLIMLLVVFVVFESKGEIWYVLIPVLLSLRLLQVDQYPAYRSRTDYYRGSLSVSYGRRD